VWRERLGRGRSLLEYPTHTCTQIPHTHKYTKHFHTHTHTHTYIHNPHFGPLCVNTHTPAQWIRVFGKRNTRTNTQPRARTGVRVCVCVCVWEAGTVRAALSASVSEDVCITILLQTLLCGHANSVVVTHTHKHTPTHSLWCLTHIHTHTPTLAVVSHTHTHTHTHPHSLWCLTHIHTHTHTRCGVSHTYTSTERRVLLDSLALAIYIRTHIQTHTHYTPPPHTHTHTLTHTHTYMTYTISTGHWLIQVWKLWVLCKMKTSVCSPTCRHAVMQTCSNADIQ